jgi:hypothetical protein
LARHGVRFYVRSGGATRINTSEGSCTNLPRKPSGVRRIRSDHLLPQQGQIRPRTFRPTSIV